jgi:hypothetical protein
MTYPEFLAHTPVFTKRSVFQLRAQDSREFDQPWEDLTMREWIAEHIPEECRTVRPDLIENIVI